MTNFILCLAATLAVTAQAERTGFHVQHVKFGESSDSLRDILARDGVVALTEVPGLALARKNAFTRAAQCVSNTGHSSAPLTTTLQDLSTRSTWAAHTGSPLHDSVQCPGATLAMEELRSVVNLGSAHFVQMLDESVLTSGPLVEEYTSFQDMLLSPHTITSRAHLDHVHVYEKTTQENDAHSLEMHTDQGLFICVVPSVRVFTQSGEMEKEEDSFLIEQPDGQIMNIVLPDEGDVLLFMMGDGINSLKPASHTPLRVVAHSLVLSATPDSLRVWMGRMFFAPSASIAVEQQRRQLDFSSSTSLGCSQSPSNRFQRLLDVTDGNCTADMAFCWMQCRPRGNLTCADPICQNPNTGAIWVSGHDMQARLTCATSGPTAAPASRPSSAHAVLKPHVMLMMMMALLAAGFFVC